MGRIVASVKSMGTGANYLEETPRLRLIADVVDGGKLQPRKLEAPALRSGNCGQAFRNIARDVRLLSRVKAIFEAGAAFASVGDSKAHPRLLLEQCFLKGPNGSPKPMHQDNYFFEIQPEDAVITAWISLDDSNLGSGNMEYVVGSHRHGILPHTAATTANLRAEKGREWSSSIDASSKAALSKVSVASELFDRRQVQQVATTRGSIIFHHGTTLHRSGQNRTQAPRRAYSLHFVNKTANIQASSSILEDSAPLENLLRTETEKVSSKL